MATFAEQMVEKYRTLLADSAGLKSVTVDGQSVTYRELEERLLCNAEVNGRRRWRGRPGQGFRIRRFRSSRGLRR